MFKRANYCSLLDGHAYIFAFLKCCQFNEPRPTVFLVDTGCSVTTVLSDDTVRLSINCDDLQKCSSPVSTAKDEIYPYELPNVDLVFRIRHGWLNQKNGLARIRLGKINVMPPEPSRSEEKRHTEIAHTLLGMDVLLLFRKWKFENKYLILKT